MKIKEYIREYFPGCLFMKKVNELFLIRDCILKNFFFIGKNGISETYATEDDAHTAMEEDRIV